MKRIIFLSISLIFVVGVSTIVHGQKINTVKHEIKSDNSLEIQYLFDQVVTPYSESTLKYKLIKNDGSSFPWESLEFTDSSTNRTFIFVVPSDQIGSNDVTKVEFQLALKRRNNRRITNTHKTFVDLTQYKTKETEINSLNSSNTDLEAEKNNLEENLTTVKTQNGILQQSLNKILKGNQPEFIEFEQLEFVTDDKIAVSFRTDKPGRIKATLTGGGLQPKIRTPNDVSELHTVIFESLNDQTEYRIKAEALSLEEREPIKGVSISADQTPSLKITTKDNIDPPNASAEVKTSHNEFEVTINSNKKVFAEVSYTPIAENDSPQSGKTKKEGVINKNKIGKFSGDQVVESNTPTKITLNGLEPNTQYVISVRLVTEEGKTPSSTIQRVKRTDPIPKEFNFDKAINVQMSPIGIKVSWNSTLKPDTANLDVIYEASSGSPTKLTLSDTKTTITDKKISGNIGIPDVMTMIQRKAVPIIRVIMTKDKKTIQRDFQVSFYVPTQNEIANNTQLTGDIKTAVEKVSRKMSNGNNRIKWKNVLKSGLSLFLKAVF